MKKTIFFDMDGTIANFYGVEGWLESLMKADTMPYEMARPLFNFSLFARLLHKVQANGYDIAIISWTSKGGNQEFNERIATAKLEWLDKHLPSVEWNEINIVNYGFCKDTFRKTSQDILFDDETGNREAWQGVAYGVEDILETLKALV